MKKILFIISLSLIGFSAWSFSAREHATVAVIADKYLTPKARAAIDEITAGEKISLYASFPDKFRDVMIVNGVQPKHSYSVDANFKPDMNYESSTIAAIELAASKLKDSGYKNCPKDSAEIFLSMIIHYVGDMHCPSHIKYPKNTIPKSPKYYRFNDKDPKFHKAWDNGFVAYAYPGGPVDLAYLADIASETQRKEYQKGTPVEWGEDNARCCFDFVRDVECDSNGVAIVDKRYAQKHAGYAKSQIMKAGYRLAEILNRIFK